MCSYSYFVVVSGSAYHCIYSIYVHIDLHVWFVFVLVLILLVLFTLKRI